MTQFSSSFYQLGSNFYSLVSPRALTNPKLVAVNPSCTQLLNLPPHNACNEKLWLQFSGHNLSPSAKPLAMVYAGHQFGGYSAQLGDGRGVLLGELQSRDGPRDIHLKGAGKTPYSRFGDGYAVMRSSIREYLASIAMESLNIPSSAALCLYRGDNPVRRETIEPAAILTRVARTHIRFGHFEYFHYSGKHQQLKQLADYVIGLFLADKVDTKERYYALLAMATQQTAQTIALWQAEGFAHGVMNTDNMSIIGETLDYGPFGFMEAYHPGFICNHSDQHGRYAFDQQPSIGLWNLNALAFALSSLIPQAEARNILASYQPCLHRAYHQRLSEKLGIESNGPFDEEHRQKLFDLMEKTKIDYSLFFRHLSRLSDPLWIDNILNLSTQNSWRGDWEAWLVNHRKKLQNQESTLEQTQSRMLAANPKFILRNYLAQQAIDAAHTGDYHEIEKLQQVLLKPYEEHPEHENLASAPPPWASKIVVSCSS